MAEADPKPGRPRDARIDKALVEAALEVFLERGYHGASLSEVARKAGVGTPAIYRRWTSKAHMAVDVMVHTVVPDPIPDTGSIRRDLTKFMRGRLRQWASPLFHKILLPLLIEASSDQRLAEQVRHRFVEWRTPNAEERVRKAITTGQLRPRTSPSQMLDQLQGTIALPLLFSQDPPDGSQARAIVDQVLDGFAAKD